MISRHTVDEILSRTNIVDVVHSCVPTLKKSGKNYHACCPFHDEKTPSFTVEENKQFYYCFGCGAGGSALDFVINYENIGFVDAVKKLAANCGVDIDDNDHIATAPKAVVDLHNEDKLIAQLYKADNEAGRQISSTDYARYKLAVARIAGNKAKYPNLI